MLAATCAKLNFISVLMAQGACVAGIYFLYILSHRYAGEWIKDYLKNNSERIKVVAPTLTLVLTLGTVAFFAYMGSIKDGFTFFVIGCTMIGVCSAYLIFVFLPFFASLLLADEADQKLAAFTLLLEAARLYFWALMVLGIRK